MFYITCKAKRINALLLLELDRHVALQKFLVFYKIRGACLHKELLHDWRTQSRKYSPMCWLKFKSSRSQFPVTS